MKKLLAMLCAVVMAVSFTSVTALAGEKTKSVAKTETGVTITTVETLTTAEIQAKIDKLTAEKAALIEKHNQVAAAHADKPAKKAKVGQSIEKITEKYDARIAYYQSLLN